jgi:hypothetical protein
MTDRMVRLFFQLVLTLLAISFMCCEREVPPGLTGPSTISGYRIEGFVSDNLGNPVRGIAVALHYDYLLQDQGPPPSQIFQVTDPSKTVRVSVLDRASTVVRVLLQGRVNAGPLEVEWDERSSDRNPVPSGVYVVQFEVDGEVKMTYPVTVSGAITARTDSMGHYVIPDINLPVGFYPVPLYGQGGTSFLGNHRISSYVVLEFYLEPRRVAGLSLTKDQITRYDLRV